MQPERMLELLNTEGESAASTFNDNEEVLGYFGWSVQKTDNGWELTITFDGDYDEDEGYTIKTERSWSLAEMVRMRKGPNRGS